MEINTYYIMAALVILCAIIAIVIGVWYNINYGKFTPWFVSTQSIKLDKSSIIKERNMS